METWTEVVHEPNDLTLYRVYLRFGERTYRYRRSFTDQFSARAAMLQWRRVSEGSSVDLTGDWIPVPE